MLWSKFKQIILPQQRLNNNAQIRYLITSRYLFKRWMWYDGFLANVCKKEFGSMSGLRFILRDFHVWTAWTRSNLVSTVVKRCKRDPSVREVIQLFRQTFRPKRTLLISATAAFKARGDGQGATVIDECNKNITDEELEALLLELDGVETLSKNTLFCNECGKRLVIEKKLPGVPYCTCKVSETPVQNQSDGWVPYMEAEDVIIWRKEYKPGLGLYVYKVYGRYSDIRASDFAAVQVDSVYRTVWDAAVASLAVVECRANGLADQAVLHWEVLWPRLFANRDYVYIRRHKEFKVATKTLPHKDGIFRPPPIEIRSAPICSERPSVHSKAKRKAMESCERARDGLPSDNKVYIIISRSCEHPKVPETKHAIRVSEYWSHMVVKTVDGPEKVGMEFVLTYYDEPAVGGMPSTVAAWATGRAAPAYLQRMRRAAIEYRAWRLARQPQKEPEFLSFVNDVEPCVEVSNSVNEQDMESSQTGPDLEATREQGTQTDAMVTMPQQPDVKVIQQSSKVEDDKSETDLKVNEQKNDQETHLVSSETDNIKADEEEPTKNGGWWRYLYPFYYFV